MELSLMSWPDVVEYLKTKQTVILPIGSTEQHGPNGICGTDQIIAERIARVVGERTHTLVTPTLAFGMSHHHMAFPGTVSLRPTTLIAMVIDVIQSLYTHGFRFFYFINGHGGNTAILSAAFSQAYEQLQARIMVANWWEIPEIVELQRRLFGEKNGHHATPSEISQTIFFYPDVVRSINPLPVTHMSYEWPLSPSRFKALFPDGRMESDPSLARAEYGKMIFEQCVESISEDLTRFAHSG